MCDLVMETITSISIAVTALFITLYEVHATRKHNKLSVSPKLTFYGEEATDKYNFQLQLKNEGLGPAIITSFRIIIDNETIDINSSPKSWSSFFDKLAIKKPNHYKTVISPNATLGINGSINILYFEYMGNKDDEIFLKNFKKRLPDIKFICEYKSMYGCKEFAEFDGRLFYQTVRE